MGNGLKNCGLLDGTTGWSFVNGGQTVTVDEGQYGAPGRAVLIGSGTTTTANQNVILRADGTNRFAVSPGDQVEVFADWYSSALGVAALKVQWFDATPAALGLSVVPQVASAQAAIPSQGARSTFNRSYGILTAPASAAFAELRLIATPAASGTAFTQMLRRPYIGAAGPVVARWDPGAHANDDLDIPVWPSSLAEFRTDSTSEPFASRAGFTGDANVPNARRLVQRPIYQFRGRVRVDDVAIGVLEDFNASGQSPFYVVNPKSDRLCFASWLPDGDPKPVDQKGPSQIWEVGLKLKIA